MNLCCRSTVHCLGCCAVPCCPVLPLLSAAPKRVVSVGITLKQSKEQIDLDQLAPGQMPGAALPAAISLSEPFVIGWCVYLPLQPAKMNTPQPSKISYLSLAWPSCLWLPLRAAPMLVQKQQGYPWQPGTTALIKWQAERLPALTSPSG